MEKNVFLIVKLSTYTLKNNNNLIYVYTLLFEFFKFSSWAKIPICLSYVASFYPLKTKIFQKDDREKFNNL